MATSQPLNIKLKKIPFQLNTARNHYQPPLSLSLSHPISAPPSTACHLPSLKSPVMKSSSGPAELPATGSAPQLAPISSSYRAYHPEWASVSPPPLDTSFNDRPEFYSAPPRKKLCHLLNPPFRPNGVQDVVPEPRLGKSTNRNPTSAPPTYSPSLQSPSEAPQVSCSSTSLDAHASSNLQFSDDHEHGSHNYPAVTQPQPMSVDDDRILSSRPLKNTSSVLLTTKRAAQNRAAQRAFRERKDRYVRELEARSTQFEEYILRYGLLEERERLIEAREAELTCRSSSSKRGSIQEIISSKEKSSSDPGEDASMNYGSKAGENDKKDYIASLEDQLEDCRREITRLRSELLKVNDQDEEMNKGNRRVSDWERGSEGGFTRPRTGSASDVDTGGPASCSPGSSLAWSTPKALPRSNHHTEWARNDRVINDNSQKTSDEGNNNDGFTDNRKHSLAAVIHSHEVPLRRTNILHRQNKLVRLPAIHHHLRQIWAEDDWKR